VETAVILSACRTPIGSFQGGLKGFSAPQLGSFAIKEAIKRAGVDPGALDEVIMGIILPAGMGQNPARQAAIGAGVPPSVGALTVNKVCGSGMKSIMLAATNIKAGEYHAAVAGGMESMTNAPYLLPQGRVGYRLGDGKVVDSMVLDGLWDVYNNFHMGMTGELIAEKYNVTREQQDEYAVSSYNKALKAIESGHFKDEIVPVEIPQRKGDPIVFDKDEEPKPTTMEVAAKMKPAFKKEGGTVTAINASKINDGAAALVVTSESKAKELGKKPMAKILGYSTHSQAPAEVMEAPIGAVRLLWEKLGKGKDDFDLYEINEPFAAASVAVLNELGLDESKVNINGGAVALGHPIGATGARITTTLLYALKRTGGKTGIASLCLGGGEAVAIAIEMV
jgi:acetyl-CoA C-acetyltransferase